MTRKEQRYATWILLGGIAFFFAWYMHAADYSYRAISGTYVLKQGNLIYTLTLHADRTFEEHLAEPGNSQNTRGSWRRIGEGGVVFAGAFITPSGVTKSSEGSVYAEANKSYTLRPSLDFRDNTVRFYKKFF